MTPDPRPGCFWPCAWGGAAVITALALGEWIGFPRIDGPFGGLVWMVVQAGCFLVCLTGCLAATVVRTVPRARLRWMWLVTFYPVVLVLVLMMLAQWTN